MNRPLTVLLALTLAGLAAPAPVRAQDSPGPILQNSAVRRDARTRREAPVRPTIRVDIEDGAFRFDVAGTLAVPPGLDEETWSFAVDFGAEFPASCSIHVGRLTEMGALSVYTFERWARGLLNALDAQALLRFRLTHYETRVQNDRPVLETDWVFYAPKGRVEAYGVAKVRLAYVDGNTVVCSHNMLGYDASFSRLFNRMVESMEIGKPPIDPHYQAFFQIYYRGVHAGFRTVQMRRDDAGQTQTIVYETRHL
ncbi:MAG: hypothetical protein AAFU65_00745, partial [Pseudomonadota bacterium]